MNHFLRSVPICLEPMHDNIWEEYVSALKKMGAKRVFLSAPALRNDESYNLNKYKKLSNILAERIAFFNKHNIEVGFWMAPTLGWGVLSRGGKSPYQQLVSHKGTEAEGIFCPLDVGFKEHFATAMKIMAESGVDIIMLEDDFRLHLRAPEHPFGCFCPLHLEQFKIKSGLNLSRDEIAKNVLTGKPNKIRDIWLDVIGNSLMDFAKHTEKAVHSINPNTRIGMTSVMSLWSNEGVDMVDLLKSFAGNTQPFVRAIGAPYWSREPSHASWIVEYTRLQFHWLHGENIEFVGEGDTYPHTRYHTSAAMLHAMYQGILASGIRGMLDYGIVFAPPPSHEMGYINKSWASNDNYNAICAFFPVDYVDLGINTIETSNNFKNITMPEEPSADLMSWPDESAAIHLLSRMGIPISHGNNDEPVFLSGYGAYGFSDEKINHLLKRGAIIDAVAAGWLLERGFDIGITALEPQKVPRFEIYKDNEICGNYCGECIWLIAPGDDVYYKYTTKAGAKAITEIVDSQKRHLYDATIHYESENGNRFCLLPFDLKKSRNSELNQVMLDYARQEQLTRSIAWVAKKPLAVTVNQQPNIHVICRCSSSKDRIAIAIQNAHLDEVNGFTLRLNPNVFVGEEIEMLLPKADSATIYKDFKYENDGLYGYLTINCKIPPMELIGVGLTQKKENN